MKKSKIAFIGGGQIGGNMAFFAAQKELGDIVVFDIPEKEDLVKGKALDILESTPLISSNSNIIGTSSYKDIKDADVVIITAGVPRKPGMSRDDLLSINLNIIKSVSKGVKDNCPNCFSIIITNPLDAMVFAYREMTGFDHNKVAGMAGVLDTARYRAFIAMELNVSVKDVNAVVLGGHGPTMVPMSRLCTVGGVPVKDLISEERLQSIEEHTRKAGGEIVQLFKNGSAYYSPAASAIEMAEAYLKDQKRILPCAAYCTGQYGISDMYIGVPCVIGRHGIEKILEIKLDENEKELLNETAKAVRNAVGLVKEKM